MRLLDITNVLEGKVPSGEFNTISPDSVELSIYKKWVFAVSYCDNTFGPNVQLNLRTQYKLNTWTKLSLPLLSFSEFWFDSWEKCEHDSIFEDYTRCRGIAEIWY